MTATHETLTPYETIELYGLTEAGTDELPIPDDDQLRDRAVREAFEALIGTLQGSGLASEIEPLAHGLATVLQRRATTLDETADRLKVKIEALIRAQDGSEVAERELEEAQRLFERTWEKALALGLMAEAAAEAYERETGDAYVPVTGSRTTARAMETGAVFEAKRLLERAEREAAARHTVEGMRVAVAGATDWTDVAAVWARLDRALERRPDLIVCHKGTPGAERIAAAWARARKVPQILFLPNWAAFSRAAPFKATDEMVGARLEGVILFGGGGIALNLAQKAEARGIPRRPDRPAGARAAGRGRLRGATGRRAAPEGRPLHGVPRRAGAAPGAGPGRGSPCPAVPPAPPAKGRGGFALGWSSPRRRIARHDDPRARPRPAPRRRSGHRRFGRRPGPGRAHRPDRGAERRLPLGPRSGGRALGPRGPPRRDPRRAGAGGRLRPGRAARGGGGRDLHRRQRPPRRARLRHGGGGRGDGLVEARPA